MTIEIRQLQDSVKEWVFSGGSGDFSEYDVYSRFGLMDADEKSAAIAVLEYLVRQNQLERVGKRRGWYRLIDRSMEIIDWRTAATDEFKLDMPFKLHQQARIFPKSIIAISGEKNSSKTAICLALVRLNMNRDKPIFYFSSEMLGPEFKVRLQAIDAVHLDEWEFTPVHRTSDFHDVIQPDAINIIDYLEITDQFYLVGKMVADIWARLNTGIAIICVQKDKNKDHGRGGSFLIEKPRLTMNLSKEVSGDHVEHTLHVTNCKFPRSPWNPNGMCINFVVRNGWELINKSDWYYYGSKPVVIPDYGYRADIHN